MTTTRELSISVGFADTTKRALKFSGIPEDIEGQLKARIVMIKRGTGTIGGNEHTFTHYLDDLRSSSGASATGITAATYTITEKTAVYDASSYTP